MKLKKVDLRAGEELLMEDETESILWSKVGLLTYRRTWFGQARTLRSCLDAMPGSMDKLLT